MMAAVVIIARFVFPCDKAPPPVRAPNPSHAVSACATASLSLAAPVRSKDTRPTAVLQRRFGGVGLRVEFAMRMEVVTMN